MEPLKTFSVKNFHFDLCYVAQEATEDIHEGSEHYHIAQAVDPFSITHDNGVFEH